ncbi:MAG: M15 family metallopeptidase [Clostridia bacterium]|nr:M15 family metallopeptidase [Clostridia bacterium]
MEISKEQGDLVRLLDLDSDFIIDLKYAGTDNFTGQKIYASNECYMDITTARMLIKAKNRFKKDGYRVKIYDAYRPTDAQEKFWEVYPVDGFVARPPSQRHDDLLTQNHTNGLAVDITLTDMDGNELVMPSKFDDFTEAAFLKSHFRTEEGAKNAWYMRDVMEWAGFLAYEGEWWHFYNTTVYQKPMMNFPI